MGRNKDSLIALAEKLTGETCGNVLTKKDALKKIACFYAGEEVECNTVADALQCIAEHCSGGGGASSGEKEIDLLVTKTDDYSCTVEVNKLKMGVDFVELGLYKNINIAIMYDSSWKSPTSVTENTLAFNFPNTTGNEYTIAIATPNEENNIPIASFIMPDTNESVAVQINEGGGSSESAIEYIRAYTFDNDGTTVTLFSFKEVVAGFNILFSVDESGELSTLPVEITEINEDSFVYDDVTFTRDRTKDLLIFAKNEQVEVEFISGYDTGITSYNFATGIDSQGSNTTNQRFGGSYYDGVINCDLVMYIGSGRIGYYKIKQ